MRPAYRSVRDRRGESNAAYDVIAVQRGWKLRPNRVTVAPRACGMAGCRAHSDQGVRGAEAWGALQPLRMCPGLRDGLRGAVLDPSTGSRSGKALVPPGDHRESEAQSLRSGPWAAVRRAGLDPMQPVPDSGTGTLQVSRHETLEKPETESIIASADERREGFGGGIGPTQHKSLALFVPALRTDVAPAPTPAPRTAPEPTSTRFRRSGPGAPTDAAAPSSAPPETN